MNTFSKKFAKRLREEMKQISKWKDSPHIIGLIHRLERGDYDDIFGVAEPTLEGYQPPMPNHPPQRPTPLSVE